MTCPGRFGEASRGRFKRQGRAGALRGERTLPSSSIGSPDRVAAAMTLPASSIGSRRGLSLALFLATAIAGASGGGGAMGNTLKR